MLAVGLTPQFKRQFKKLERNLQEEALEKIEMLKDPAHHAVLRVHKLHGALAGRWSLSVNYRYRIVFIYEDNKKTIAALLAIGDHEVYQ